MLVTYNYKEESMWVLGRALRMGPLHKLHSFFQYPARFPLHIVDHMMKRYSGSYLDPFAGSGTVLVHAYYLGHKAKGYDLLPILPLMVKAKIDILEKRINVNEIENILKNVEEGQCAYPWLREWWPKEAQGLACGLIEIIRDNVKVKGCGVQSDNPALILMALELARRISWADDSVYKWFRSKMKRKKMEEIIAKGKLREYYLSLLERKVKALKLLLSNIPRPRGSEVKAKGCKDILRVRDGAEVIFTSPPYLQAHEYVRSFKYEMLMLGLSIDVVRALGKLEIPYREVKCDYEGKLYLEYMERVRPELRPIYRNYFCSLFKVFESLEANVIALFTGPASLSGISVPIHEIMKEYFEEKGFREVERVEDPIRRRRLFKGRNNRNSDGIEKEVMQVFRIRH